MKKRGMRYVVASRGLWLVLMIGVLCLPLTNVNAQASKVAIGEVDAESAIENLGQIKGKFLNLIQATTDHNYMAAAKHLADAEKLIEPYNRCKIFDLPSGLATPQTAEKLQLLDVIEALEGMNAPVDKGVSHKELPLRNVDDLREMIRQYRLMTGSMANFIMLVQVEELNAQIMEKEEKILVLKGELESMGSAALEKASQDPESEAAQKQAEVLRERGAKNELLTKILELLGQAQKIALPESFKHFRDMKRDVEKMQQDLEADLMTDREQAQRRELLAKADDLEREAQGLFRKARYENATDSFNEAVKTLEECLKKFEAYGATNRKISERITNNKHQIVNVKMAWARSVLDRAERFNELEDAEKASAILDEILPIAKDIEGTDTMREIVRLKKACEQGKKDIEYKKETDPKYVLAPYEAESEEIKQYLERGSVFMNNGRYADAREQFEYVLSKEPANIEAIRSLTRINTELARLADARLEAVFKERLAEVRWKWAEPIIPTIGGGDTERGFEEVGKTDNDAIVKQRLESITVTNIVYEHENLEDVLTDLRQKARDLDTSATKRGINWSINLKYDGAPQPQQQEQAGGEQMSEAPSSSRRGGGGDSGEEGSAAPIDTQVSFNTGVVPNDFSKKTVDIDIAEGTMLDVLEALQHSVGFNMKFDRNAVIITHPRYNVDPMDTVFYKIKAGVLDVNRTRKKMSKLKLEGSDDDDSDDDDDDDDSDDDDDDYTVNVADTFYNMGVKNYVGNKIYYYPKKSLLAVTHDRENQKRVEYILSQINEPPDQIAIESKFVEIDQTNLESLGFEWTMEAGQMSLGWNSEDGKRYLQDKKSNIKTIYDADGNPVGRETRNIGIGGGYGSAFQLGFGEGTSNFSKGLRTMSSGLGQAAIDDGIFSVYSILGNYAFNTVIHALQQEKHSDVLSAPKITTVSGVTGIVKVVTLRYFPEDWEEPELESSDNSGAVTYKPATPTFGDSTELGVMLDVTPVVAPDRYTIDLDLWPQVTEFVEYETQFNTTQIINDVELEMKNGMMPILTKREVKTRVIVNDGETVVLGGMIQEHMDRYEDRIPFLGDLPLIGFLFRSRGESSRKTNLLMFVTARIVKPNGQPLRPEVAQGVPDFRH